MAKQDEPKAATPKAFEGIPTVKDAAPVITNQVQMLKLKSLVGVPVKVLNIEGASDPTGGDPSSGGSMLVTVELPDGQTGWVIIEQDRLYQKMQAVRGKLPVVATISAPRGRRYYDVE